MQGLINSKKIEKGLSTTHKYPENPYYWDSSTVAGIIDNRQYTGCTVNFIYEDNILGKSSADRYSRMASMYENEQRELIETISKSEQELEKAEQHIPDEKEILDIINKIQENPQMYKVR